MGLIVRNDEQIKVGTTPGLVAGSSSFIFDGTSGKPDYRNFEIIPTELNGRGLMIRGTDYSWDYTLGEFNLLIALNVFNLNQVYNIHFQSLAQPLTYDSIALINSSFFIRDINLPNLTTLAILERLNSYIKKYEPLCLENCLGYNLHKLLISETSDRMTDLVFGAEYYDCYNVVRKWKGLVHDTDISLIANYVYFFFQRDSATQTTGVVTKLAKAEAGTAVSPADKMIAAWNFMSEECDNLRSFLWMKKDITGRIYPEFTESDFRHNRRVTRKINFFGI